MAAANPPPEQSAADTAVDPDQKLLEDPPATDATPPREEMDVAAAVGRLEAVVSERLSYDAEKEEAFSRLYKDLEHFRGEALAERLRPVLLDLILLLTAWTRPSLPTRRCATRLR